MSWLNFENNGGAQEPEDDRIRVNPFYAEYVEEMMASQPTSSQIASNRRRINAAENEDFLVVTPLNYRS